MKKWSYDSETLAMAYPHHITWYMCCNPRFDQNWPKKWTNWSEKLVGPHVKIVFGLRNFGHGLSSSYYMIYELPSKIRPNKKLSIYGRQQLTRLTIINKRLTLRSHEAKTLEKSFILTLYFDALMHEMK